MYDMDIPKKISSLLLNTSCDGGSCSRALTNLNTVLRTAMIEKINVNKNKLSKLSIVSFFSFFQNFISQSL